MRQITSIEERTKGLKKIDGFFPLYWDEPAGKLWLEIPKLDTEVLYSTGLATGLGSNDIGLDRGILTGSRIVKFERAGPRVLMVQPNYQFRGADDERGRSEDGAGRVRAVGAVGLPRSRPRPATACSSTSPSISSATATTWPDVCARDRIASTRRAARIYTPMTLNFPKNTEMEAELTFVRNVPAPAVRRRSGGGPVVAAVAALAAARFSKVSAAWPRRAEAASIRIHHSIVELPDGNYKPRRFDPRSGLRQHGLRKLLRAARTNR